MKYAKLLNAVVLISIGLLIAPEPQPAFACSGSSGSVCTVTTNTCLKTMVMAKSSPGTVLLPPATPVTFNIPVNLYVKINNPAPGCAPCPMPATPVSARIDMVVSPLLGGPMTATAFISTGTATMTLPMATPGGNFNSYLVPITVPAGTATGAYRVVGKTTVNFSDGLSLTQSGDTVVCLVDPAPGNPSMPRLSVQLLTPSFPRMAAGDQHIATYRITNNDPTNSVTVTGFANGKQAAVRPQGANEMQGVFTISSPFGDDFPIGFGPGPCLPLPGHPFTQPEIMTPIPPIPPNSFFDVFVEIRSYGMCASGSCSESTMRVSGTFADSSPAFACASMALYVDNSMPTVNCLPRTDDCNNNGIPDAIDIANGTALDINFNAVLDECEAGQAPIIFSPAQINPPVVLAGGPIQVMVQTLPDFGMPTTRTITNVNANGLPLNHISGPLWVGTIPADTRPGPQTVYVLSKESNGAIATHIGVYTVLPIALASSSALSRKTHGGAGNFDINLPLTGSPGIECRNTGGDYKVIITFNNNVVGGNASVTAPLGGSVSGSPTFGANTMTVNLAGVMDVQQITVTAMNVIDEFGQTLPVAAVPMKVLTGDTSGIGNSTVNSTDVSATKAAVSAGLLNGSTFRSDVNASGTLTGTDISIVKSKVPNMLP